MQTIYAFSYNPVIATGTNTTGTNWRMAYQQPIMLYKGTTNQFRLVVFSVNQKVVNLTGYGVQIQIVDRETQEHFVTKTATITAPASGVATITLTEEDLRNLQHRFYHLIAKLINPNDGSSVDLGEILYLDDNYGAFTPITIENAWNYNPTSISTVDGIPAISFTNIGQTPDSLDGQAGKYLRVNATNNAIEFADFSTFDKNIIPSINETFNLGDVGRRWNFVFANRVNVGNICIYGTQIGCENSPELDLKVLTQSMRFTDNSTDPAHQVGDGGFLTFFDNTHQGDGPRFEIWYGKENSLSDPPGQHSLDIRAATNSYVEFASNDLKSFMGIDAQGPYVQTNWDQYPDRYWRFLPDGELSMPFEGSKITSHGGQISLLMNFNDFRINLTDFNNVTHSTIFDTTGNVYFEGSLLPGTLPASQTLEPQYSLGSATRPWKDLYVSNSTIYLGNVALGVDAGGDLTVNGNSIVSNGGVSSTQPYIELTNNPFIISPIVYGIDVLFIHGPNSPLVDEIDTGLTITRGANRGLYNLLLEEAYDANNHTSPAGTEWNSEGWANLRDVHFRTYTTLYQAVGGSLGDNILGYDLVMHDIANDKYYKVKFSEWGQNNGGSFAYTRTLIEDIPEYFVKKDNVSNVDIIVPVDGSTLGIAITRGSNQGIYNPLQEQGWNSNQSPAGTLWNIDGWDDLSNVTTRTYTNFYAAYGNGQLGNRVPGSKAVMYIPLTGKYYAIQWLTWTQSGGGGFSYLRYEIDLTKLNEGIRFADGTILKSGAGLGRVKSTAIGNRRIEEVAGNKTVTVTPAVVNTYLGTLNRTTDINYEIYVVRTPELDEILIPINQGTVNPTMLEISLDGGTTYISGYLAGIQPTEYWFYYTNISERVPQVQGEPVSIRITTGGNPVVWWDKNELPSGGTNFRGAVIDYHAYTGDGTTIGTIHIVDDSGDERITHTEVNSGNDQSLANNDLWVVSTEGQISYRRLDGQSKTLKVHWTAKVFYGDEFYD